MSGIHEGLGAVHRKVVILRIMVERRCKGRGCLLRFVRLHPQPAQRLLGGAVIGIQRGGTLEVVKGFPIVVKLELGRTEICQGYIGGWILTRRLLQERQG